MGEAFITRRGGGAKFTPASQLFSSSGTYSVPYTGTYRITAIGKGADGYHQAYDYDYSSYINCYAGGAGGGGVLEVSLNKGDSLSISISTSASNVKKGSTTLINATAGSKNKAGSVSGTGVVGFSSNGKETSSITPPSCYNNAMYISKGGLSGWGAYFEEHGERDSEIIRNAGNGGSGLFGGDGGNGGDAIGIYVDGWKDDLILAPEAVSNGAGAGGTAYSKIYDYSSLRTNNRFGGGGGGGGYGGGGGANTGGWFMYNYTRFVYSNPGAGGAGCVFIERIG